MLTRTSFNEMASIFFTVLPKHLSRKRAILNFFYYALISIISFPWGIDSNIYLVSVEKTGSKIWDTFQKYIYLYNKYFKIKFLLRGYIIRRVAGGYADPYFNNSEKSVLTPSEVSNISRVALQAIDNVAEISANHFSGVDKEGMRAWLQTYQFAVTTFDLPNDMLISTLQNCQFVELGAGIGANAAVHAQITHESVLIYDLPVMFHIQRALIDRVRSENTLAPVDFISSPGELIAQTKGKKYVIFSYWAFTEFPLALREQFKSLIQNSEFALFASNTVFEGIENFGYFEDLCKELNNKSLLSVPICWSKNKSHRYFLIS